MMERLHQMGFRLMLWITPYISPDSAAFRKTGAEGVSAEGCGGRNGGQTLVERTERRAGSDESGLCGLV